MRNIIYGTLHRILVGTFPTRLFSFLHKILSRSCEFAKYPALKGLKSD